MLPYPLHWLDSLSQPADSRILLVVLDGVGDLPRDGETPLSAAATPHLDELARESSLGLSTAIAPGVSPGSGPGHLALFGYDPLCYDVGRGVLSALGIDLELAGDEVAARGNFATLATDGTISDRRAGRPTTERNREIIEALRAEKLEIDGVEVALHTESEHRFVVVLHGEGLGGAVGDTDPGRTGEPPQPAMAETDDRADRRTATVLQSLAQHLTERLKEIPAAAEHDPPISTVLLRGIGKRPDLPQLPELCGMRFGSDAAYPMYRGVSRLVGMTCLPADLSGTGERTEAKLAALREHGDDYDFIFFHVKKTDSYAEDGDFDKKSEQIELFDAALPQLLAWQPDVVLITGDHSTPAALRAHSWHPLPVLLWSRNCRPDGRRFHESDCRGGSLGSLRHLDLMPLLLANALRLRRFGA